MFDSVVSHAGGCSAAEHVMLLRLLTDMLEQTRIDGHAGPLRGHVFVEAR